VPRDVGQGGGHDMGAVVAFMKKKKRKRWERVKMEGVCVCIHLHTRKYRRVGGIIIETRVSCQTRPTSGQIEPDTEMKSALMEIRRVVFER